MPAARSLNHTHQQMRKSSRYGTTDTRHIGPRRAIDIRHMVASLRRTALAVVCVGGSARRLPAQGTQFVATIPNESYATLRASIAPLSMQVNFASLKFASLGAESDMFGRLCWSTLCPVGGSTGSANNRAVICLCCTSKKASIRAVLPTLDRPPLVQIQPRPPRVQPRNLQFHRVLPRGLSPAYLTQREQPTQLKNSTLRIPKVGTPVTRSRFGNVPFILSQCFSPYHDRSLTQFGSMSLVRSARVPPRTPTATARPLAFGSALAIHLGNPSLHTRRPLTPNPLTLKEGY
jgi:hypothetical protein